MVQPEEIKRWIEQGLPGCRVDIAGDGRHFSATIVSADFVGKSRVERHRLVYQTLGDKMQSEVHALSMRLLTPEQVSASD